MNNQNNESPSGFSGNPSQNQIEQNVSTYKNVPTPSAPPPEYEKNNDFEVASNTPNNDTKNKPVPPPRNRLTFPNLQKQGDQYASQNNLSYFSQNTTLSIPQIHSPLHRSAPCSPKSDLPPSYSSITNFRGENHIHCSYDASSRAESPQISVVQKSTPTVFPIPNFNPHWDSQILFNALKSSATDEKTLISLLCHRTDFQRQEITKVYFRCNGNYPVRVVGMKTQGNLRKILMALCTPTRQLHCQELRKAVENFGTDEDCLIEVLCSLSNEKINDIKVCYHQMYQISLEEDIVRKKSGHFKNLLLSLAKANRDESGQTDNIDAQEDATELMRIKGSNEAFFTDILCRKNFEQLKLVCRVYESMAKHPLQETIKKKFSGNVKEGFLAILDCAHYMPVFFAKQLCKSMVGIGTNNSQLIRLVVTRCEVDMIEIKEIFQRMYRKTLKSFVKSDTSGNYRHALYELINENQGWHVNGTPQTNANQTQNFIGSASISPHFQQFQTNPTFAQPTIQYYSVQPPVQGIPVGIRQFTQSNGNFLTTQNSKEISDETIVQETEGPTLLPAFNFNPQTDAKVIRKALKGFETNHQVLADVLCHRTDSQRQKIVKVIEKYHTKNLMMEMISSCSGLFSFLMLTLLTPIIEIYCEDLHNSLKSKDKHGSGLIELLCSLSNDEIANIKMCYERKYQTTLEKDIGKESFGSVERILVSLCNGARDESGETDIKIAKVDARELYNAGESSFKIDKSTFNKILCQRNFNQLRLVLQEYRKLAGHSLETALSDILKDMGESRHGYLSILNYIKNKNKFFADQLYKSIGKSVRNDSQFVRLIITHCEVDMIEIKEEFYRGYGITMKTFIKGYALGNYLYALCALIGEDLG